MKSTAPAPQAATPVPGAVTASVSAAASAPRSRNSARAAAQRPRPRPRPPPTPQALLLPWRRLVARLLSAVARAADRLSGLAGVDCGPSSVPSLVRHSSDRPGPCIFAPSPRLEAAAMASSHSCRRSGMRKGVRQKPSDDWRGRPTPRPLLVFEARWPSDLCEAGCRCRVNTGSGVSTDHLSPAHGTTLSPTPPPWHPSPRGLRFMVGDTVVTVEAPWGKNSQSYPAI